MAAPPTTVARVALHVLLALAMLAQGLAVGTLGALHALGHAGAGTPAVIDAHPVPDHRVGTTLPPCHPPTVPEPPTAPGEGCAGLCAWVCAMSFAAVPLPAAPLGIDAPRQPLPPSFERFHSLSSAPPQRPPIAS